MNLIFVENHRNVEFQTMSPLLLIYQQQHISWIWFGANQHNRWVIENRKILEVEKF